MSAPLYYEGTAAELEKKFNYYWQGGTWTSFKSLVALEVRPKHIRDKFYTVHPVHKVRVPMSREAYFRWRRSLKRLAERDRLKVKEGRSNATG